MATTNWNLTRHKHWKISYKNVKTYRPWVNVGRGLLARSVRRRSSLKPERVATTVVGPGGWTSRRPARSIVPRSPSLTVVLHNNAVSLLTHQLTPQRRWRDRTSLAVLWFTFISQHSAVSLLQSLRTSNMDARPSRAPAMDTRTPPRGKIPLTRWVVYSILRHAFIDHKTTRDKISDAQTLMFCFRRKIIKRVRTVYYTGLSTSRLHEAVCSTLQLHIDFRNIHWYTVQICADS